MFELGIVRGWLIPWPIYVGVLTGAVVFFSWVFHMAKSVLFWSELKSQNRNFGFYRTDGYLYSYSYRNSHDMGPCSMKLSGAP